MVYSVVCLLLLINVGQLLGFGEPRSLTIEQFQRDVSAQAAFREAINHYNGQINSAFSYAPYQVHSIIQQLVAGNLYKFDVTLIGTKCKNVPNDKSKQILLNCGINETIQPKRTLLRIVSQPWMKPEYSFKLLHENIEQNMKLHDQLFVIGFPAGETVSGLDFENFKKEFNKVYKNAQEELKRSKILHSNFKKAILMRLLDKGDVEYGITQFSDLTEEEFREQYLSPAFDLTKKPKRMGQIQQDIRTPQSVDWRKLGAVTPVKNQGSCGSCWAFSTTGNIEGQWSIKMKQLISLSEQQLVDCDTIDQGCNGGLPSQAYKAIQQMGGLESEDQYSYTATRGTCKLDKSKIRVYINGSETISSSENLMAGWNALNGPISIGINAFAMQFYHGGVSHPLSIFCNPNHLDHGVLIVGFNTTTTGEPFWIIKNSWGPSWGEDGYYRIYRGSGSCGLNKMPTSAIVN